MKLDLNYQELCCQPRVHEIIQENPHHICEIISVLARELAKLNSIDGPINELVIRLGEMEKRK